MLLDNGNLGIKESRRKVADALTRIEEEKQTLSIASPVRKVENCGVVWDNNRWQGRDEIDQGS